MPRLTALVLLAAALLAPPPAAAADTTVPASRQQIHLSFAPVVRQVSPAVVNIYTRRVVRAAVSPFAADPFFSQFFGGMRPPGITQDRVLRSLGSGVIVGADGIVVTNHHVIKDADQITVVLADRREFAARVVGSDERSDLAVLKIDTHGEKLPTLPFGDSDALEVGDLVLAIGNPFGVGQTVTSGIVSALARTNIAGTDFRSFIQTDAAINPGNSGGALVDMDGKLVGINSAIYSKAGGGSIGIGFAIPSALVKVVLADITRGGKVVHPWLGAGGQTVTPEIAEAMKLARPVGVLVNRLSPDGPAAKGGLRMGDVVTAVQGREIDDPEGMRFRLATLQVGDVVRLTVLRGGAAREVDARLIAPPEIPPRDATEFQGANPLSGALLANLNPALAEEIELESAASGVVVLHVRSNSIAQRLEIQPGDIILTVNGHPVASVADAKRLLGIPQPQWRLTLNRGGQTLSLEVGG